MPSKKAIAEAIIDRVEKSETINYGSWRIGLTHDHAERWEEWGKPEYWKCWKADSLDDAQEVESFFIHKKGMQGDPSDTEFKVIHPGNLWVSTLDSGRKHFHCYVSSCDFELGL